MQQVSPADQGQNIIVRGNSGLQPIGIVSARVVANLLKILTQKDAA